MFLKHFLAAFRVIICLTLFFSLGLLPQKCLSFSEDDSLFDEEEEGDAKALLLKVEIMFDSFSYIEHYKCKVRSTSTTLYPESPDHLPGLHRPATVHRLPSRLEPEDPPPLHLTVESLLGRTPQSAGGGAGPEPTLSGAVRHPASQPAGGSRHCGMFRCSS